MSELPIVETREHESWKLSIMDGNHEMSRVRVVDRRLRLGRASLRFGGLADVFTDPAHRNKGLSRRLVSASLKLMERQGHHLAMLFGIRNYYEKWGYRTSLSDYRLAVPGRSVVGDMQGWEVRDITPEEHALTLPLHRRWLAQRGFGIERESGRWLNFTKGANWHTKARPVGLWQGGKLRGYVVPDNSDQGLFVSEIIADSAAGLRALLCWLGNECRRQVRETINIELPHEDVTGRMALALDGVALSRNVQSSGGGMTRVVDLSGLMTELTPELAWRWQHSHLKDASLRLAIHTDAGRHDLSLGEGTSAATISGRVRLPQDRLMQLVLGYRHGSDVSADEGVQFPRKLLPAIEVLFPVGCPHILRTDLF